MRLCIFASIIFLSGLVGFEFKKKYVEQRNFLEYLREFLDYVVLNISVYKNDMSEIINNYLMLKFKRICDTMDI